MRFLFGFTLGVMGYFAFKGIAANVLMTPFQLFWRVLLPATGMFLALMTAAEVGLFPFLVTAFVVGYIGKRLWY